MTPKMTNDFEAIKEAAKRGWLNGWHHDIARQYGLPITRTTAYKTGGRNYPWEARFHREGPLAHIPPAQGKTKAEAVARLICEARGYLKREENAKAVMT